MINELNEIWTAVLGTLSACGGIGGVFFYAHNKKMKALEAALAEANVNKAKVESKADEWHIWKEQCEALSELNHKLTERNQKLVDMNAEKEDRHQQDIKDWESRFTDQTTYLRGVQRDLISANEREKEHIRREGVLERRVAYLITWICKKSDCDHGVPPRDRLKGHRFDDAEVEEVVIENSVTINLDKQ